jgi:hypothetical protein
VLGTTGRGVHFGLVRNRARVSERRPLGIPVSRAILLPPGPLGVELQPALEAIDRVHGAGPLPRLAVMPDPTLGADASYEVIRATGEPYQFAVNPDGQQLALSLVHEIGHFLVHAGLGFTRSLVDPEDLLFEAWRNAIKRSERFATLTTIANLTSNSDLSARLRYELRYAELWARSYAQYIALRSGDEKLRMQVAQRRLGTVGGIPIPIQWGESDFAAIANTIDDLLRGLGWTE